MDIKKLDRTALKSYFVKNAVPTESNFADLIDGMINQKEDGVAKLAGEPLSIQADGSDTSQKKAINFYRNFADPKPAWTLSLNPRADPNTPATAKPGWSIGDADGNSKLFIDQNTGNVGVGTTAPAGKLEVNGVAVISNGTSFAAKNKSMAPGSLVVGSTIGNFGGGAGWNANTAGLLLETVANTEIAVHDAGTRLSSLMYYEGEAANRITIGRDMGWGKIAQVVFAGAITPSSGNSESAGIMFPKDPGGGGGDAAWLRYYARQGEACTLELGISNDGDDHIALMSSGNVGIGTTTPAGKLHVQTGGAGSWDRFVVKSTNLWGDGGTQYVTIGEGGAAGIMFYNPHVVWYAPEARASIRMGRSGGIPSGHWWDIGVRGGNVFSIVDGQTGAFGLSINEGGTVKVNVLQIGDKWRLSGVGDWGANDDWLRLANISNTNYFGGLAASKLWSVGGVVQGSDLRLKRDVTSLRPGSADILKLRGVRFKWVDAAEHDAVAMGLIAQEVEEIFPEVVSTGPDGMKGINYGILIAPLIEAVKQQQAQIGELRAEVQALRAS